jgi:hypothetical protein
MGDGQRGRASRGGSGDRYGQRVSAVGALEVLMSSDSGSDIDSLFQRPAWQRSAACRGQGSAMFFGSGRGAATRAMALCESCPVAGECRAAAIESGEQGVWGGTTAQQRRDRQAGRVLEDARFRSTPVAI